MSTVEDFALGDVVIDIEEPEVRGIVTLLRRRSFDVVWEHGGRSGGPGLVPSIRHVHPRLNVPVPEGALGNRGWNREQAVGAALRRAHVPPTDTTATAPNAANIEPHS